MNNPAHLSKAELLKLLQKNDAQLSATSEQLSAINQLVQAKDDTIRQLEIKLDLAQKDYLKLWQERFLARSERYLADPDQLRLDFGDTEEAADAAAGLHEALEEADLIPAHRRRKPKPRSEAFPAHFPRTEIIVDAAEADKTCPTHGEKQLLPESMWDVREKLIYTPPTFYVEQRKYQKYACVGQPACGIATAERPTGIVEGDRYDSSVAAQIIAHKYAYHLPLYRQQDLLAGSGWTPARSTLLNILSGCHEVVEPLLSYFKRTLQGDSRVACDDTGLTLLYPKVAPKFDLSDAKQKRMAEVFAAASQAGKPSINAKMWAYRGVTVRLNYFDFTVSRHRDGPEWFFEGFRGTLLGDCWQGFGAIAAGSEGAIVRAACNAHARRKFDEAIDYPADRHRWMQWFQQLYEIESRGQTMSAEERLTLRGTEADAIWRQMREELDSIDRRTTPVVLPKSELRKGLNYVRNHWTELTRYLSDPGLPIDNNETEQLMKQVALGRKNWLFAGSVRGGERNAGFLTLVSSAHRNDLDVWAYVSDILKQLLAGETNYEPLLPWNWAATHPQSIRQFRQEERRARDTRKKTERAKRRARATLLKNHRRL